MLVEHKAHVDKCNISEFECIAKLYGEIVEINPKRLIVGASVTEKAVELAKTLGIEIKKLNI